MFGWKVPLERKTVCSGPIKGPHKPVRRLSGHRELVRLSAFCLPALKVISAGTVCCHQICTKCEWRDVELSGRKMPSEPVRQHADCFSIVVLFCRAMCAHVSGHSPSEARRMKHTSLPPRHTHKPTHTHTHTHSLSHNSAPEGPFLLAQTYYDCKDQASLSVSCLCTNCTWMWRCLLDQADFVGAPAE